MENYLSAEKRLVYLLSNIEGLPKIKKVDDTDFNTISAETIPEIRIYYNGDEIIYYEEKSSPKYILQHWIIELLINSKTDHDNAGIWLQQIINAVDNQPVKSVTEPSPDRFERVKTHTSPTYQDDFSSYSLEFGYRIKRNTH